MSKTSAAGLWKLTAQQHGVVSRPQLIELGYGPNAIQHRIESGRLFRVFRGVYAVGRPEISSEGSYLAAVLACGPTAVLSHAAAASLWRLRRRSPGTIEVSVTAGTHRRHPGLTAHRRRALPEAHRTTRQGVPVTSVVLTIVDIASRLNTRQLEAVVNEADKRDLISPANLLAQLDGLRGRHGVRPLREMLSTLHYAATDSELERMFLRICRQAGLPLPVTGARLNGHKVDFYWPALGLIVETDGLRYHRNEVEFARDRRRDQDHAIAGFETLRFTHRQVAREPRDVAELLTIVIRRLERAPRASSPVAANS